MTISEGLRVLKVPNSCGLWEPMNNNLIKTVLGLLEKVTGWEEDGVNGAGKDQTVKS